jgi:hypothetical protein
MARFERTNKRLWVVILILIAALIGSNAGWIYYESQYAVTETTISIEAGQDGDINIVGGGDVSYGAESEGNNENPDTDT